MAFYKKRYYKKSKKPTVSYAVKKYVKKTITNTAEDKFNSGLLSLSHPTLSTSWIEKDLTELATGGAGNQRVGDEVMINNVGFEGVIVGGQSNNSLDDSRNIVRIVVAEWDGRVSTPLATNAATISDILRKDEIVGKGLIRVLYDKVHLFTSFGRDSTGYMPTQKHIKFNKKLLRKIKYASSTASEAQTRIILSMISDSSLAPGPGFVQGKWYITFKDQ